MVCSLCLKALTINPLPCDLGRIGTLPSSAHITIGTWKLDSSWKINVYSLPDYRLEWQKVHRNKMVVVNVLMQEFHIYGGASFDTRLHHSSRGHQYKCLSCMTEDRTPNDAATLSLYALEFPEDTQVAADTLHEYNVALVWTHCAAFCCTCSSSKMSGQGCLPCLNWPWLL